MVSQVLIASKASPKWVLHFWWWMFQPSYRGEVLAVNFRDRGVWWKILGLPVWLRFLPPWLYHRQPLHTSYSFTEPHHHLAVEDRLPSTTSSLKHFFLQLWDSVWKGLYKLNVLFLFLLLSHKGWPQQVVTVLLFVVLKIQILSWAKICAPRMLYNVVMENMNVVSLNPHIERWDCQRDWPFGNDKE